MCDWVSERDQPRRDRIEVAALDPFRGYATALATSLPDAVRVLDTFHVTRLGFAAVDDVRRRVQQDSLGHRGRKDDPLFRVRRLLRRRADRLTGRGWDRLLAALAPVTWDHQIGLTWIAAQDLRTIFDRTSRYAAEQHLHRWLTHCADADVPELRRLARTIDAWRSELLAYFDTGGVSNGPTEAMNSLIKKVKRVGHGFRNFETTDCGSCCTAAWNWQTPNQHESEADYHAWLRRAGYPESASRRR